MTVSDQIIEVLNALCEKFGMAIDWTGNNVIPYLGVLCGKLISYEIWTSVACMAIMVTLSIAAIIVVSVLRKKMQQALDDLCAWPFIVMFIAGVIWLATVIMLGCEVFDIIKCTTFPEMYIVEYVQGLLSSGS